MMQFLSSDGYDELSKCSSMIRNLVHNHGGRQDLSANTVAEIKAAAACYRHSEAERRRRKRINGHLATLRSILPNTVKADKASLLAEVVRQVKELKKISTELKFDHSDDTIRNYESHMIPSEHNEHELTYVGEDSRTNKIMIKVSMCCEDRPELIVELTRALGLVQGKLVRAEIGTLGGRLKCVLWVQVSAVTREHGLDELRRELKAVTDRALSLDFPRNKRSRFSDCV